MLAAAIATRYRGCMAQVLIRNLDGDLVESYRAAARLKGTSLEAELREALARARPDRGAERAALIAASAGTVPPLTEGQDIVSVIRRYRDPQ